MQAPENPPAANMTLRDLFAAMAMAAMVANFVRVESEGEGATDRDHEGDATEKSSNIAFSDPYTVPLLKATEERFEVVEAAYEVADAMLERREARI